jgi:asparagine synthase (glutamine-hydrolysing)
MADVPLGAFLSGGVDSSVVVASMAASSRQPVRTFSIGFDDPTYDERPYASLVAERFGTLHREERVGPEMVELADKLADMFDEPFADVSAFPTHVVSALARKDVTVVLSGDGGDELFAGYDAYRAHRWAERLRLLSGTPLWTLLDRAIEAVPPSSGKKGPVNKAKRFVEGVRRPADLEHARWWVFADVRARRELYTPALQASLRDRDPFGFYRSRMAAGAQAGFTGLDRQLFADLTGYLPDDILVKVDRMSMAVSLEARVPFLDHELVEFAMTIPGEWKLDGRSAKTILKSAFSASLPAKILKRRKEGFSIPMKNWLRGPLRPLLEEALGPSRVGETGWFRHEVLQRLVREHVDGRANHAHRLWCVISLDLSLRGLRQRSLRGHLEASRARPGVEAT